MQIRRVSLDDITPAPYNPRVVLNPSDPEYQALERSLEEFGDVEPLVWNARTGHLVGGHQRFEILKAKGAIEFDVSVVDLNEKAEKALNLALNKIRGKWDDRRLFDVLHELNLDTDLTLTGFSAAELGKLAESLDVATPLFSPTLPDVVAPTAVSATAVVAAEREQRTRFAKNRDIQDITCPYCGELFGVSTGQGPGKDAKDAKDESPIDGEAEL